MVRRCGVNFGDPNIYLDRINPDRGTVSFLPSSLKRLQATIFLDGRSSFTSDPPVDVEIDRLIVAANHMVVEPRRVIAHMSFCGSTQLARLVDECGAGTVLKEPHALVDLADWQRMLREHHSEDPRFTPAVGAVLTILSRRWPGAPPTVIKPSNWANPVLAKLPMASGDRVLMLTITRRAFLVAAFRGGRDRLTFLARAASHFAVSLGQVQTVDDAISSAADPLDQAARLVMVAHALQGRLFATLERMSPVQVARLDYAQILADPLSALTKARDHLALDGQPGKMEAAVRRLASSDAKQAGAAFSVAAQDAENQLVEMHQRSRFDETIAWAASALPEARTWP